MTYYVLNKAKMYADISEGIAIIINSDTGIYYGLNELGTVVFDNLMQGCSCESILAGLMALPKVPAGFEERYQSFIQELSEKEIVKKGKGTEKSPEIPKSVAEDCCFELSLTEYSDVQDMLLADPIHEIKEDIGWTPEKDSIGYTKEETREREKKVKN